MTTETKTRPIKRALISVSDKAGVVEFARFLSEMGVSILSTGGTLRALKEAAVPVTQVADYTGSPEILDGRVKTLHPKIHGGILGRRDMDSHLTEMAQHGIEPIDLVVVNLYPFEKVTAASDCTYAEAVENIDIGGPCMVRASAKNHAAVTIIVDPEDYAVVQSEMAENSGATTFSTRQRLALKAFKRTSEYDGFIATYFEGQV